MDIKCFSRRSVLIFVLFIFGFVVWCSYAELCSEQKRAFLNVAPHYYYYTEYMYCATECCGYITSRFCCEAPVQTVEEGLSTGAIAGIAVGCTVALIIIVVVIVIIAKCCCPTKVQVLQSDEKTRLAILAAEHRFQMRTQLSKSTGGDTNIGYSNLLNHPYFSKNGVKKPAEMNGSANTSNTVTTKLGENDEVDNNDNVPFWRQPGNSPFKESSPWSSLKTTTKPEQQNGHIGKEKVKSSDPPTKSNSSNVLPSLPPVSFGIALNQKKTDDDTTENADDLLNQRLKAEEEANKQKDHSTNISSKPPSFLTTTTLKSLDNPEDPYPESNLSVVPPLPLLQTADEIGTKKKSKNKRKKKKRDMILDATSSDTDTDAYPTLAPLSVPKTKTTISKVKEESDDDVLADYDADDIFGYEQPAPTSVSMATQDMNTKSALPPLPTLSKPANKGKPSYDDFGDSDNDSLFNGIL